MTYPPFKNNPVVAVQPTVGWYAVPVRVLVGELPQALPVEHATVHADGTRALWVENLKAEVEPLHPEWVRFVVRAAPDATRVQVGPREWAEVAEESTASWRPMDPA